MNERDRDYRDQVNRDQVNREQVNKNSIDAWFARLEERLTNQDQVLQRIESQVKATNGRVTALERWRNFSVGVVTVAAAVIGWIVSLKSAGK